MQLFFWEKLSILGKVADLNKEAQMLQQDGVQLRMPIGQAV